IALGVTPYHSIEDAASLRHGIDQNKLPIPLDDVDYPALIVNLLGLCWTLDPALRPPVSEVVSILGGKNFKFERASTIKAV
ncbi:hypothetical protein FRB99_003827, partial [Tulasnella sp. 403]